MTTTIDRQHDIPVYSPICTFCVHLGNDGDSRHCDAFPERESIPMDIWMGDNNHLEPIPDQGNDIVFEKAPG